VSDPDAFLAASPPPRSDDDTFDIIDDAVTALAQRRGLWIGDEHVMIHLLASLIDQAERCLPHEVTTARANGTSWNDIAKLLGTSPDEARLRFDPDSPVADGRWPWKTD
jgi:hypothetical protein